MLRGLTVCSTTRHIDRTSLDRNWAPNLRSFPYRDILGSDSGLPGHTRWDFAEEISAVDEHALVARWILRRLCDSDGVDGKPFTDTYAVKSCGRKMKRVVMP